VVQEEVKSEELRVKSEANAVKMARRPQPLKYFPVRIIALSPLSVIVLFRLHYQSQLIEL
jgi:hypothetical protein